MYVCDHGELVLLFFVGWKCSVLSQTTTYCWWEGYSFYFFSHHLLSNFVSEDLDSLRPQQVPQLGTHPKKFPSTLVILLRFTCISQLIPVSASVCLPAMYIPHVPSSRCLQHQPHLHFVGPYSLQGFILLHGSQLRHCNEAKSTRKMCVVSYFPLLLYLHVLCSASH